MKGRRMLLDLAFKAYTRCAVEEGTSALLHFEGDSAAKSLDQETPIRFAVCRTFPDRTKRITKKTPRDYSLIPSAPRRSALHQRPYRKEFQIAARELMRGTTQRRPT